MYSKIPNDEESKVVNGTKASSTKNYETLEILSNQETASTKFRSGYVYMTLGFVFTALLLILGAYLFPRATSLSLKESSHTLHVIRECNFPECVRTLCDKTDPYVCVKGKIFACE